MYIKSTTNNIKGIDYDLTDTTEVNLIGAINITNNSDTDTDNPSTTQEQNEADIISDSISYHM